MIKIGQLQPEKSRNMFERIQIIKKSFSTFHILFVVASRVCAIEQFGIQHWKEKTNLMIKIILKSDNYTAQEIAKYV